MSVNDLATYVSAWFNIETNPREIGVKAREEMFAELCRRSSLYDVEKARLEALSKALEWAADGPEPRSEKVMTAWEVAVWRDAEMTAVSRNVDETFVDFILRAHHASLREAIDNARNEESPEIKT